MEDDNQADESSTEDQNKAEFLWYYSKDRNRIYSFIYSMVPNATDAEDIFQQTSIVLWKKFGAFDKTRDFYSWACGVAYRDVQSFRRLTMRKKMLYDDDLIQLIAEKQMANAEKNHRSLDLLDECIAHLKETDRKIITQVYREQLAVSEVAEMMNRAKRTIYNRLNIIRNGLLECIDRKRAARDAV